MNSARPPFIVFTVHVFGDEPMRVSWLMSDSISAPFFYGRQSDVGITIWRSYLDPASAILNS
jgi:hypothetical protein